MSGKKTETGRRPVLAIIHIPEGEMGHLGRWLLAQGYGLDVRRPRYGDPLPETLAEHSGVVVFGGPMSATEPEDYMRRELDWLDVPLAEERPYLGVCLGAQMLALKLGGEVGFHAEGMVETGYQPIRPTAEGAALMDWPSHVYHWHREGFTLPRSAVRLAEGEIFENQAFRHGARAFGVQFHPELSHRIMTRWTAHASQRLALPGARPRAEHISGHLRHGPQVRQWLDRFLRLWIGLEEEHAERHR